MITNYKLIRQITLYIFFIFLSLNIFFFSTTKVEANAFDISDIEISKPFEINFDKNQVIDEGFEKAFLKLILLIVNSSDQKKIEGTRLNQIKGMVESFSIKEEKFIDENYNVVLGVSFNKLKVFKYLENKNIFPSIPIEKKVLFIPVLIDESEKELLVFSDNIIFDEWNNFLKEFHLLEYVLPTEDLEDINILQNRYETIENYDFEEIISKYNLKDSIVALIFKNENKVRILSKISINNEVILKNQTFPNINIENKIEAENIINKLKITYEDYWKNFNQINTSIRLPLKIKISNSNNSKVSDFEKILKETDLIYNFFISKFDKDFTYYQIIFNGTPNNFLKTMSDRNYKIDTQNKIWILK